MTWRRSRGTRESQTYFIAAANDPPRRSVNIWLHDLRNIRARVVRSRDGLRSVKAIEPNIKQGNTSIRTARRVSRQTFPRSGVRRASRDPRSGVPRRVDETRGALVGRRVGRARPPGVGPIRADAAFTICRFAEIRIGASFPGLGIAWEPSNAIEASGIDFRTRRCRGHVGARGGVHVQQYDRRRQPSLAASNRADGQSGAGAGRLGLSTDAGKRRRDASASVGRRVPMRRPRKPRLT